MFLSICSFDISCLVYDCVDKIKKSTETVQDSNVTFKWQEMELIPFTAEVQWKIEDVEVIFLF